MNLPEDIVLLDSLGDLQPNNTLPILVCGSHCGDNGTFARKLKDCRVKAVFLNNAGVGKNQAGISGLIHYEAENILACAVDHYSAEIGVALDTWESGTVSHMNHQAEDVGIQIGDSVKEAVSKITKSNCLTSLSQNDVKSISRIIDTTPLVSNDEQKKQVQTQINGVGITVTNSITFLNESNAGDIVVCGSHGGLSAGYYAKKYGVKAVFFNDAGIGKNKAGARSLEILDDVGIFACTVDCMSAEIFNGQDILDNGIITLCNKLAQCRNVKVNMTVKEALKFI